MSKLPDTYKKQSSCVDCKLCFKVFNYVDNPQYFCTYEAGPRPLCGSPLMKEQWPYEDDAFGIAMDKWEEWSDERSVDARGICDLFIGKKNEI